MSGGTIPCSIAGIKCFVHETGNYFERIQLSPNSEGYSRRVHQAYFTGVCFFKYLYFMAILYIIFSPFWSIQNKINGITKSRFLVLFLWKLDYYVVVATINMTATFRTVYSQSWSTPGDLSGIALTCKALSGSRLFIFTFPAFSLHLFIIIYLLLINLSSKL